MAKKFMAVAVALMMAFVAGVIVVDSEESDAAPADLNNIVKVYFLEVGEGKTVKSSTTYGYDLYQALDSVEYKSSEDTGMGFSVTVDTSNQNAKNDCWKHTKQGTGYTYEDPNENYGTLNGLYIGSSSVNVIDQYDIYVYNKITTVDENNNVVWSENSWHEAVPALGWYHPFDDYSAYAMVGEAKHSLAAASIAIVPSGTTPGTNFTIPLAPYDVPSVSSIKRPISSTSIDDRFIYEFTLSSYKLLEFNDVNVVMKNSSGKFYKGVLTASNVNANVTNVIYGFGSNAYEALKDALGSTNVVAQEQYQIIVGTDDSSHSEYYTWMDTILGIGTNVDTTVNPPVYHYWSSYVNGLYSMFTLGYYSNMTDAQNSGGTIQLSYV